MARAANKRLKKYEAEGATLITCRICGFAGKDLTGHIGRFHKMPVAEYHRKFQCGTDGIRTPEYLQKQSIRYQGEKNPGYQHGGRLSVFSENNVNFSKEKKDSASLKVSFTAKTSGNNSTTLSYWLKQGFSIEEAEEMLSKRQTTFSLEICIQKYGEEEGKKRWQERQTKWMNSYTFSNYSMVSQTLFWKIWDKIGTTCGEIRFAELNPETLGLEKDGTNNEAVLILEGKTIKPDFLVTESKIVIEFDGDYWHERRTQILGNETRERERDAVLEASGYKVLHVKERDYNKNIEDTVDFCVQFINENKRLS